MTVVSGAALVGAVQIDDWDRPSASLPVVRHVLAAAQPKVLFIPPGYANGFMSLTDDTRLIFFSTSTLDESKDDDVRYHARHWDIWTVEESDGAAERGLPSFAVVVPMFNERAGAERCVGDRRESSSSAEPRLADCRRRRVEDGTAAMLDAMRTQIPALDVVTHPTNRGYGAALVTGAARA